MKMYFKKQETKIIHYRHHKMLNTQHFRKEIFANLQNGYIEIDQMEKFLLIFKTVLDRHAPI